MLSIPASAITSASPSFWQVMPWAPALTCICASSGLLCVLICGRLATPAASQAACPRAILRSTLSMSMTAQGVPYSLAMLAARGVVIGVTPVQYILVIAREQSDEAIHVCACYGMDCFASLAMTKPSGLRLFDLFAQNFQLQPAVFGRSQLLLRLRDRGRNFLEFLAILGIEIGIVKQALLPGNLLLQLGDGLRQRFQRVLFVEIEPAPRGLRWRWRRGLRLLFLWRWRLHLIALQIGATLDEHVRIAAGIFDPLAVAVG